MLAKSMTAGVLQRARAAVLTSDGARKFAADSVWAALEALGARGLGVAAMMLAARLLGTSNFGALAAVLGRRH